MNIILSSSINLNRIKPQLFKLLLTLSILLSCCILLSDYAFVKWILSPLIFITLIRIIHVILLIINKKNALKVYDNFLIINLNLFGTYTVYFEDILDIKSINRKQIAITLKKSSKLYSNKFLKFIKLVKQDRFLIPIDYFQISSRELIKIIRKKINE